MKRMKRDLTPKQERFIAEYLKDLNATQAAIRAGYSAKTAVAQGPRLLGNVEVAKALAARQSKQLETADLSAARVLEELRRLAFADIRAVFDENGNLRPIHTLTQEQAACIGGFEVIKKNAEVIEVNPGTEYGKKEIVFRDINGFQVTFGCDL